MDSINVVYYDYQKMQIFNENVTREELNAIMARQELEIFKHYTYTRGMLATLYINDINKVFLSASKWKESK